MRKLSLERWVGKLAILNNPELIQYELVANMTPEQRLQNGFPVEFPVREETDSRALQYEREARQYREKEYKRIFR